MTDEEKSELGAKFANILQLKADYWSPEMKYKTSWGLKSNLGIYEMIVSLGQTANTGKFG